MRRLRFWLPMLCLLVSSCNDAHVQGAQGQTHWLRACERDGECGGLECICGVCIAACDRDGECDVAGRTTECRANDGAAAAALCRGDAPVPICLEPCAGGCDRGQRCADGACVPSASDGGTNGSGEAGRAGGSEPGGGGGADSGAGTDGGVDAGACATGSAGCEPEPADGGAPADAGPDGAVSAINCVGTPPVFPAFDRSCTDEGDCAMATRQINCCGTLMVTGVRTDQVAAYERAAATCASQFPLCGCANGPTRADDGTTQTADETARTQCIDGECRTTYSGTATTACGPDLECDSATEVCVAREPVGPAIVYECRPVPSGCQDNRTCACTGATLCANPFNACSDEKPNSIICSCLQCQ